jgi:hypothetical protein
MSCAAVQPSLLLVSQAQLVSQTPPPDFELTDRLLWIRSWHPRRGRGVFSNPRDLHGSLYPTLGRPDPVSDYLEVSTIPAGRLLA